MKYIGIDGDDIGAQLEFLFLQEDENAIRSFSKVVDDMLISMSAMAQDLDMEVIFQSGDSLLCKGKETSIYKFLELLNLAVGKIKFSVGIGCNLRDTYLALKYAKVSGKNRIIVLENSYYRVWESKLPFKQ